MDTSTGYTDSNLQVLESRSRMPSNVEVSCRIISDCDDHELQIGVVLDRAGEAVEKVQRVQRARLGPDLRLEEIDPVHRRGLPRLPNSSVRVTVVGKDLEATVFSETMREAWAPIAQGF